MLLLFRLKKSQIKDNYLGIEFKIPFKGVRTYVHIHAHVISNISLVKHNINKSLMFKVTWETL